MSRPGFEPSTSRITGWVSVPGHSSVGSVRDYHRPPCTAPLHTDMRVMQTGAPALRRFQYAADAWRTQSVSLCFCRCCGKRMSFETLSWHLLTWQLSIWRLSVGVWFWILPVYVGHMLCRNCLLKHVIKGKRRRGRRRKQLLDNVKERRRYWNLEQTALDRNSMKNSLCKGLRTCRMTDYAEWIQTHFLSEKQIVLTLRQHNRGIWIFFLSTGSEAYRVSSLMVSKIYSPG